MCTIHYFSQVLVFQDHMLIHWEDNVKSSYIRSIEINVISLKKNQGNKLNNDVVLLYSYDYELMVRTS